MGEQEIVERANELAREFYAIMGNRVVPGYRFDRATHPQERMCWQMACKAFEHLQYTDVEDALSELEG